MFCLYERECDNGVIKLKNKDKNNVLKLGDEWKVDIKWIGVKWE